MTIIFSLTARTRESLNNLSRSFSIVYCLLILSIFAMITVNIFREDGELQDIMQDIDTNMNGDIHLEEFRKHFQAIRSNIKTETIEQIFNFTAGTQGNNTVLSREELKNLLDENWKKLHEHNMELEDIRLKLIDGLLDDEFTSEVKLNAYSWRQ